MKRSVLFAHRLFAVLGAVLLTLAITGCGTMVHPMSDDAQAGLIPSGRGAP
jgi:hypothetical protein